MPSTELIEEYKEIGLNLRHYSNMTYVNLTLFLTVNAALISGIFRANEPLATTIRVALELIAILLTVLFFINEYRLRMYWHAYFKRAVRVEEALGVRQYTEAPKRSRLSSAAAVRTLVTGQVRFGVAS